MRGASIAVLCLQLGGCSFFLPSVANAPPGERLNCGGRAAPPLLDTLLGIPLVVGGSLLVHEYYSQPRGDNSDFDLILGVPALVVGALALTAAVIGFRSNRQCVEHNAALSPPP